MTKKSAIINYMRNNWQDHYDPITNTICCTTLAEDAACKFDLYDSDCEIPDFVFDLADEVENYLVLRKLIDPII